MLRAYCFHVYRGKDKKQAGFQLRDENGRIHMFNEENLKRAIENKQILVTNISIKDGKIVRHRDKTVAEAKQAVNTNIQLETEESVKKLMAKANLLGRLEQIPTFDGHHCYLISKTATQHIIYIPDEVTTLNDFESICDTFFTKHITLLHGYIQVIGGHHLNNTCSMFLNCQAAYIDVTLLDTKRCTEMSNMFQNCTANIIGLNKLNTSNVLNMREMFENSQATTLDLSNFDTHCVVDMTSMFDNCQAEILDLSSFNTARVHSMCGMFRNSKARVINVSSFNTNNVNNMQEMFEGCAVENLDLRGFNTIRVTVMDEMFARATILGRLDFSRFDTRSLVSMSCMFYNCNTAILDLSTFDTSNVKEMGGVFNNCAAHTIILSAKFSGKSAKYVGGMFCGCQARELDLTGLYIPTVMDVTDMVDHCYALVIKVKMDNMKLRGILEDHYKGRVEIVA